MQDLNLHVVHLVDAGFGASHVLRQRIVDHVGRSVAVMNQQRQVGRLAKVGNTACLLDRGAGKLGLHELHVGAVVGSLLGGVGTGDGGRGRAIFRVVDGALFARFGRRAGGGALVAISSVAALPC